MTKTPTKTEAKRLVGLRRRIARKKADAELGGLDERAAKLAKELDKVDAKIQARKEADQEAAAARREAKRRHVAARKEREQEAVERRENEATAKEWLKSARRFSGGVPQPAQATLEAARRAGVAPAALERITIRVKRRKDGVECIAFPGTYLRRDYVPVEDPALRPEPSTTAPGSVQQGVGGGGRGQVRGA